MSETDIFFSGSSDGYYPNLLDHDDINLNPDEVPKADINKNHQNPFDKIENSTASNSGDHHYPENFSSPYPSPLFQPCKESCYELGLSQTNFVSQNDIIENPNQKEIPRPDENIDNVIPFFSSFDFAGLDFQAVKFENQHTQTTIEQHPEVFQAVKYHVDFQETVKKAPKKRAKIDLLDTASSSSQSSSSKPNKIQRQSHKIAKRDPKAPKINYGNVVKSHFQRVKTSLKKFFKDLKSYDEMIQKLRRNETCRTGYMIRILRKCQNLGLQYNFNSFSKFLNQTLRPNTWVTVDEVIEGKIAFASKEFREIMHELAFGADGQEDYRDWSENGRMKKENFVVLESAEYLRLFEFHVMKRVEN